MKTSEFRGWAHQQLQLFSAPLNDSYGDGSFISQYSNFSGQGMPDGHWFATSGAYRQDVNTIAYAIDNRLAMSNGNVTATIYATGSGAHGTGVGVVGRWRNACNYYAFQVYNSVAELESVQDCVDTRIGAFYLPDYYTGAFANWNLQNNGSGHTYGIRLSGKNISGWVDGAPVLVVDDNTNLTRGWITAGKGGLLSGGVQPGTYTEFRDIAMEPTGADPS